MTSMDKYVTFGKDNIDALIASGNQAMKGFESLSQAYVSLASKSFDNVAAAAQALQTAKTPADVQSVCTSLAKQNLEQALAEGRKLQELSAALMTDSMAPINARIRALVGLAQA